MCKYFIVSIFIYIPTCISQNLLNLDKLFKLFLHYEQNYKMGVNSSTGYIPWQVDTMELIEIQNIIQDTQW